MRDGLSGIDTIFKMAIGYVMSHHRELPVHLGQHLTLALAEGLRMWHNAAEPALQKCQCTVNYIAVSCQQFVVVAANEFIKSKVCIASFGSGHREVVAQGICPVKIQYIASPDHIAATARSLCSAHRHELVCGHVVGQVAVAVAEQHRGPDDRMERDIILADQVIGLYRWISLPGLHPVIPTLR